MKRTYKKPDIYFIGVQDRDVLATSAQKDPFLGDIYSASDWN